MENSKHMATRRAFVGGSAAITAAAAMGSVCGAAAADEAWDGEYDVVVVGAGMAGLCAAITVADEGAGASCLLIEKGASCMGNSPYCGGYMMYVDNPDDAVVYLEQLTGEYTPEDVLRAFAEELKVNKDWMISLGAKEEWMIVGEPDSTGEKTGEYAEFEKSGSTGYIRFDPEGGSDNPGHIHPFLESVMMSREGVTYMTETPPRGARPGPRDQEGRRRRGRRQALQGQPRRHHVHRRLRERPPDDVHPHRRRRGQAPRGRW